MEKKWKRKKKGKYIHSSFIGKVSMRRKEYIKKSYIYFHFYIRQF